MQISQVQGDSHTGAMGQDHGINASTPDSLILRKPSPTMRPSQTCDCASTLPTSRTSFTLWHLKFELEVQEQHHRGCELFGVHRNKKQKVFARFPFKVAWFSARMTFACFEYTSGTSNPGYSVRCKNFVHSQYSPVIQTFYEIENWDFKSSGTEIVRDIEAMERRIMSMYRDGTSGVYDRDEYDMIHAEVFFVSFAKSAPVSILDDRVFWAVIRVFKKLLEINDDTDKTL
jgi:hypothetical protein